MAVLLCSIVASAATYSDWTSTNQGQSSSTSSNTYNITASAGDVLTFDWLVSSESNYDKLIITIGGTEILNKSGELSGTYQHTFTSSGSYTMVVKYTKDGNVNNGSDYAKVYNIVLSTENSGDSGSENIIASGTCGDNLTWELTNEGELIIEGIGDMSNYDYNTRSPWYSYRSSIGTVILGEGLTSIGTSAFSDCSSLTTINIPEGVTSIGAGAFYDCSSLTSITIPESATSIGEWAFSKCSSLVDVYCYAETVPPTDGDVFTGSYPENITLHVPAVALENYKTTAPWNDFGTIVPLQVTETTTLPIVLTEADSLLAESSISTNIVGVRQYEYTSPVYSLKEATNTLYFTFLKGNSTTEALYDDSGFPYVALAEFYLYDGEGNKIALNTSNFSTNAQEPYEGPIANICDNDPATFWHSKWSGKGVGAYHHLKVTLPEGQELAEFKFGYITRNTYQCLPSIIYINSTDENMSCSLSGSFGENLIWEFSDGTLHIEGTGAIGDISMHTYNFPWTGLGGIMSLDISNGITYIGSSAFRGCSLKSVSIPTSVTFIDYRAFFGCKGLTTIDLPKSLTTIGDGAFDDCHNLTCITIPKNVTSIGDGAFSSCSDLEYIICEAPIPPSVSGSNTFEGVNKRIPVYVPFGTVVDYRAATKWNEFANIQNIKFQSITIGE